MEGPEHGSFRWMGLVPQQGLSWADEQIHQAPRTPSHLLVIRLPLGLDIPRLKAAWTLTAQGYDALKLAVDHTMARQRWAEVPKNWCEFAVDGEEALNRWLALRFVEPFAPDEPAWSIHLVTVGTTGFAVVLATHDLCMDQRSLPLLAEGLSLRYQGANLPVAPFRPWLEQTLGTEALKKQEADAQAWRTKLLSPPPQAALLGATRRRMTSDCQRWRRAIPLDTPLDPQEADTLLSAAAATWVLRLGGQKEMVITLDRGNRPANAPAVGPFASPGFLRLSIDDQETSETIAEKVRREMAFVDLHSDGSIGAGDFVSVNLFRLPSLPTTFGGIPAVWSLDTGPLSGERFDGVSLGYQTTAQGLDLLFFFHSASFPEGIQNRLVEYFLRILAAFQGAAPFELAGLDLVTEDEQKAILSQGRGREPETAPDLLEAFSLQVSRGPEKVAVEFQGRRLTYRDLDQVTNRLARRLQESGVVPGSRVAVAMPRGFGEHCALLATLKAGGAYIPIDPSHPVDRVRVILEDAEPQVLVAPPGSPLKAALPDGVGSLVLDDPLTEGGEVSDAPLTLPVTENQVAYILFTSGSTGRPKGVEVPRSAFANFLQSMAAEPGLTETDRVLALTTTTFDIAGLELFLPLYVGATLVIADRETAGDPVRLRTLVEASRLTVMQATPATWRMLLEAGWTPDPHLVMLCGGEAMSLSLAHRLAAAGGALWNMYGPTETTVWSTLERVPPEVDRILIGHAIDHTQITLRDPQGRLVPQGTIGEICLGGRGLALGYRGRPDLTAEKFPTEPATGLRYYKTGDLGRFLTDGRLECLGRVDHQVKVRGFRIEPADIETQLRSVPGVAEVLVIAVQKSEGDPALVAYWVGSATREDLHAVAKAKLPYYMVPSAYVRLEAFPLTTSGKIDRKQLPAPEDVSGDEDGGTAPRNDKEVRIAEIWRAILGLSFVPVDRDFFSLGGTSLRAIQMRTRIQQAFGVDLPLRVLFDQPTIEALVTQLASTDQDDAPVVSVLRPAEDPTPWWGLMGIHLFHDIAAALDDGSALVAVHVPVRYRPGVDPFPTVEELATMYVNIIRERQPQGPYHLMGLCHGGVVAFEAAAQLQASGEKIAVVALLDAELPKARKALTSLRLKYALKNLVTHPSKTLARISQRLQQPASPSPQPIDIPFDGPEIDADLLRYERLGRQVDAEVLAFRATEVGLAPWLIVAPDMGWEGRATTLTTMDVSASHLGIVRGPHARKVAQALQESRGKKG